MRTPNVAIVMPELLPMPPIQGGAVETWVDQVLTKSGLDMNAVTVISRPPNVAQEALWKQRGVPWTPIERLVKGWRDRLPPKSMLRQILKIQNVWSYGRRALQNLDDFDVVCIQNEPNLLAMFRKRKGQRLVLHMHNDHMSTGPMKPVYRRALRKADLVICVSEYIRQRNIRAFPLYHDKFHVILNGTDTESFTPKNDGHSGPDIPDPERFRGKRVILYVGRLVHEKGVHTLLEAFRKVAARVGDVVLIIAGSSFYDQAKRSAYEEELAHILPDLTDRVFFTGFLHHRILKNFYARADIVTVPSVWPEPSGLTLLEAMASGTPVIASRIGGIPEMCQDGINAALVTPGDPDELADKIIELLACPKLRTELGSRAREAALQRFDWVRVARDFKRIIECLS